MTRVMRGRRLPDGPPYRTTFQPGDFLLDPAKGSWWCRPPQGPTMCLDDHIVTEHDNRAITVEPDIKIVGKFIGKLTKGVWFTND